MSSDDGQIIGIIVIGSFFVILCIGVIVSLLVNGKKPSPTPPTRMLMNYRTPDSFYDQEYERRRNFQ
jgi:hypothetical protein